MSRTFLAVAIAAIASGCATTHTAPLRGYYTWGHEVESFRPCGTGQAYWVVGDARVLDPLRAQSAQASQDAGKPYRPIYVEASGVAEPKAMDGFAADYAGVYRFTGVIAGVAPPAGCPAQG